MGGGSEGVVHFNWPNTNTRPVESELKITSSELVTARLDSAQASEAIVVYLVWGMCQHLVHTGVRVWATNNLDPPPITWRCSSTHRLVRLCVCVCVCV
jgi:hypothetical protein